MNNNAVMTSLKSSTLSHYPECHNNVQHITEAVAVIKCTSEIVYHAKFMTTRSLKKKAHIYNWRAMFTGI